MQRPPAPRPSQATQPMRVRKIYDPPRHLVQPVGPQPNARQIPAARPQYPLPPIKQPQPYPYVRPETGSGSRWLLIAALGVALLMMATCAAVTLGIGAMYAGGILPGVSAAGVSLGGLSSEEAAATLRRSWNAVTVSDETRAWPVNPALLGITLDAARTAEAAYRQGRGEGTIFKALFGGAEVPPVLTVDLAAAEAGLNELAAQVEIAPVNAGVALVNGRVQATPPKNGRVLDIAGTLARLQNAPQTLSDGRLELAMQAVAPAVTDSSAMVAQAEILLTSSLNIRVYDPVTDNSVYWSIPPEQWAAWLTAQSNPASPTGLALTLEAAPVRDYLSAQSANTLDASRYLKIDDGVSGIQQAVENGQTEAWVRVYHHDLQHVVQSGETIISIAWDYGVPYPWIQAANPGTDMLSPGQAITIPSPDNFLPYPVDPNKRIVVSISQQKTRVYENGALKWEWATSTGISSSPTWPGLYQIISHEPNAYAGNWDLWMPNFMGVYQPIPGSEFTNGFHGFPTRGGGQLLWENSLGTRVTYGCILLSNTNAQTLYDWAQEGVVVEIQP